MKVEGAKQVHYESGPDMTPLVDVVMVLLIFLMMVGKFGGANRYLESDMPISSSGSSNTQVDPNLIPKEPVVITVIQPTPEAFRAVNGGKINAGDEKELQTQLTALLAGLKAAGRKLDDIQVFIKPAKNVKYSHVIKVYTAATGAGFTKIGFQTSD
jgi:biopolymer transport protein ExbD